MVSRNEIDLRLALPHSLSDCYLRDSTNMGKEMAASDQNEYQPDLR